MYSDREKYERIVKITGGLGHAFKFFKKLHPKYDLDQKTYVNTCYSINKKLSNAIITESLEVRLPYRLGFLRIRTYKQKIKFDNGKLVTRKNHVDWHNTRKLWKELYPDKTWEEITNIPDKQVVIHTNEHTNGYALKWYWDKRLCNLKNISVYVFRPVKGGIVDGYYYGRKGVPKWVTSDDFNNEYYI